MTTPAAILTLRLLLVAIGRGSGIQRLLAVVIISGLVAFLLVPLAIPVLIGLMLPRGNSASGEKVHV